MNCYRCNSKMKKKSTTSSIKWILGMLIILVSLPVLISAPPIGLVLGAIMIWLGNRLQKGKKFFYCNNCGNKTDAI